MTKNQYLFFTLILIPVSGFAFFCYVDYQVYDGTIRWFNNLRSLAIYYLAFYLSYH